MTEMTKSKSSRGGGVLLKKYGPDHFKKLALRKHEKDRKAKKLWDKMNKKK